MKKLTEAIQGKTRWEGLSEYISLIEENRSSNPNVSLDGAKSLVESISKTILGDKGIEYRTESKTQWLVKTAFASLPIFITLSSKDTSSAQQILSSLASVAQAIGEFRNNHGFFSHGRDLEAQKFDSYLIDLVISSADILASFLVMSHAKDLQGRVRVHFDEHEEFNRYLDETNNEDISVSGVVIDPSAALFTDIEAYVSELNGFTEDKSKVINELDSVIQRGNGDWIDMLLQYHEFLTSEETEQVFQYIDANISIIVAEEEVCSLVRVLVENYRGNLPDEIEVSITGLLEEENNGH